MVQHEYDHEVLISDEKSPSEGIFCDVDSLSQGKPRPDIAELTSLEAELQDKPIPLLQRRNSLQQARYFCSKTSTYHLMTCLILAMPYAPYMATTVIFFNIRSSYMRMMGIHSEFQPMILPALLSIVFAPIFGAISDRSLSKLGRRNLLLVIALVVLPVCAGMYAAAGILFPWHHTWISVFLVGFILGNSLVEVSLRARVMDILPIEYQIHAQAAMCFWGSLGSLFALLALKKHVNNADPVESWDVFYLFVYTIGILEVMIVITLCLRPEHPQNTPYYNPPLQRIVRETVDQVHFSPRVFRLLCVVHFVLYFGWLAFRDQIFSWWEINVFNGCRESDPNCTVDGRVRSAHGKDKALDMWMAMSAFQAFVALLVLICVPRRLLELNTIVFWVVVGLVLSDIGLIVAVAVNSVYLPITSIAFVISGLYRCVDMIFPYSVIGILCTEMQESPHAFNQNGVYTGVIYLFSSVADLTSHVYSTEQFAKLGSNCLMALPILLYCVATLCVCAFGTADI